MTLCKNNSGAVYSHHWEEPLVAGGIVFAFCDFAFADLKSVKGEPDD